MYTHTSAGSELYRTVGRDQNTVGRDQNTVGRDQNTVGRDQNTVGRDQNTVAAIRIPLAAIRILARYEFSCVFHSHENMCESVYRKVLCELFVMTFYATLHAVT